MDRCPNCGSSVRAGAKFCTTCGFRLPVAAASDAPTPPARSPFDTTHTDPAPSAWSDPFRKNPDAEPPPPPPPFNAAASEDALPIAEQPAVVTDNLSEAPAAAAAGVAAGVAAGADEAAPFTGWPNYGTGFGPRTNAWDAEPAPDNDNALPVYEDVPPVAPESKHTVEDAVAAWSIGHDLPEEQPAIEMVDVEPEPVDDVIALGGSSDEPVTIEIGDPENAEDPLAALADADDHDAPPEIDLEEIIAVTESGEVVDTGAELGSDAGESGEDQFDDALPGDDTLLDVGAGEETDTAASSDSGDLMARANMLVAELQALLPQLTGASSAPASVAGASDALEAAIAASDAEAEAVTNLRAAIATAQARPRDVDVMLDLVSRADAIADVLVAYDRNRDALGAALSALRGETESEPAPRW